MIFLILFYVVFFVFNITAMQEITIKTLDGKQVVMPKGFVQQSETLRILQDSIYEESTIREIECKVDSVPLNSLISYFNDQQDVTKNKDEVQKCIDAAAFLQLQKIPLPLALDCRKYALTFENQEEIKRKVLEEIKEIQKKLQKDMKCKLDLGHMLFLAQTKYIQKDPPQCVNMVIQNFNYLCNIEDVPATSAESSEQMRITQLTLPNNKIAELNFENVLSKFPYLRTLNLTNNKIISFVGLHYLRNYLMNKPISIYYGLELDISNNPLQACQVQELRNSIKPGWKDINKKDIKILLRGKKGEYAKIAFKFYSIFFGIHWTLLKLFDQQDLKQSILLSGILTIPIITVNILTDFFSYKGLCKITFNGQEY